MDQVGGSLEHIQAVSAVSAVTRRLMDHFTSGALPAGSRLPSERSLATELGVGRSAVREALAALELLGVVTVRPGSGTYLKGTESELLPQTLSWGILLSRPSTTDLTAVRRVLELEITRLACLNGTDEQLAVLGACIARQRETMDDIPRHLIADVGFHQGLAAAAGNALIADLLSTVRSLTRVFTDRAVNTLPLLELSVTQHEVIYEALRARDLTGAQQAMSAHLDSVEERLRSYVRDDEAS